MKKTREPPTLNSFLVEFIFSLKLSIWQVNQQYLIGAIYHLTN